MHSISHRKALVKALTKMNIQTNATPEVMVAKIIEKKQEESPSLIQIYQWKREIITELYLSQLR